MGVCVPTGGASGFVVDAAAVGPEKGFQRPRRKRSRQPVRRLCCSTRVTTLFAVFHAAFGLCFLAAYFCQCCHDGPVRQHLWCWKKGRRCLCRSSPWCLAPKALPCPALEDWMRAQQPVSRAVHGEGPRMIQFEAAPACHHACQSQDATKRHQSKATSQQHVRRAPQVQSPPPCLAGRWPCDWTADLWGWAAPARWNFPSEAPASVLALQPPLVGVSTPRQARGWYSSCRPGACCRHRCAGAPTAPSPPRMPHCEPRGLHTNCIRAHIPMIEEFLTHVVPLLPTVPWAPRAGCPHGEGGHCPRAYG